MSKKVASDVGHGMSNRKPGVSDPGAVDGKNGSDKIYTREYDINRKMDAGFTKELISRKIDFISLSGALAKRDDIANNSNVDCGISWHCDSYSKPSAKGMTIYSSGSTKSMKLARDIEENIKPVLNEFGMSYRGIKTANFYILKHTKAPWVLLEIGFISNQQDEIIINKPEYQHDLGVAVADGVCEYLGIKVAPPAPPLHKPVTREQFANALMLKGLPAIFYGPALNPGKPVKRVEVIAFVSRAYVYSRGKEPPAVIQDGRLDDPLMDYELPYVLERLV